MPGFLYFDEAPPAGDVHDGDADEDLDFQASASELVVKWKTCVLESDTDCFGMHILPIIR
jgi:hypothetical protein